MNSFQEALIKQQLEFTLSQLEEYKQKEETLKKTNDSLLRALSESTSPALNVTNTQSHTLTEQQKTISHLTQENNDLKSKLKEVHQKSEQEKQELSLSIRELDLTMKQQKITFEGEKLQLLGSIQKLEAENFNLSNLAKLSKQSSSDSQKLQILDLSKSYAKEKEELIQENKKLRDDWDKSIVELKNVYETENLNLRKSLNEVQVKLKNSLGVIEELRESRNEMIENRTDELECQVEYYKDLYLNANSKNSFVESCEKQKMQAEIDSLALQNSKLNVELEKTQLDVKRLKMELSKTQEKYWENERNLKNEIKILIGKLMKAKSKLNNEELRETMRRENFSNRSNSSNRSKNNLSYY